MSTEDIRGYGLGNRLETREIEHNPWFALTEWDSLQVLAALSPAEPICFAMTDLMQIQAAAATQARQIIVCGGLMDMICRLCAAIVDAGIFVSLGNPKVEWEPHPLNSRPIAHMLESSPFSWEAQRLAWRENPEREQLFGFLVLQTHRFVLLHEAAHILHNHGNRSRDLCVVDGAIASEETEAEAISSMARELVADAQAFHWHLDLLAARFADEEQDPMGDLLRRKIVQGPREWLRMTLLSAHLVFQLLDHRPMGSIEDVRLRSHPPAPFRVKAIYATALELVRADLPRSEIEEEVKFARFLGSAVVDIGMNRFPQIHWLNSVNGAEFDALFVDIYGEMSRWADPALLRNPDIG